MDLVDETYKYIFPEIGTDPAELDDTELAIATGISENGVKWNLNQLKAKGILERIGADKGGYWKVVK